MDWLWNGWQLVKLGFLNLGRAFNRVQFNVYISTLSKTFIYILYFCDNSSTSSYLDHASFDFSIMQGLKSLGETLNLQAQYTAHISTMYFIMSGMRFISSNKGRRTLKVTLFTDSL